MEKKRLLKLLLPIGTLCMFVGVMLKATIDSNAAAFHFGAGFLIGFGATVMIAAVIMNRKNARQADKLQ